MLLYFIYIGNFASGIEGTPKAVFGETKDLAPKRPTLDSRV